MPYVKTIKTEKITLPSDKHYFVMWRSKVRYGDAKLAAKNAISIDARQGANATPEFDSALYIVYSILAHIESWNLDDAEGRPLPLTVESMDALDEDDFSMLALKLQGEATEQTDERKK